MRCLIAFAAAVAVLAPLAVSHAQSKRRPPESPERLQFAEKVPEPPAPSVFKPRRERLMKQLGPGVAVLYSKGKEDDAGFKSDPNFYYLTGVDEEGAVLLLAPGERVYREALFLKSVDPEAERWTGIRGMIGDSLRMALGFETVSRASALDGALMRDLSHVPTLHMLAGPVGPGAPLSPESELYSKLQARIPGLSVKNAQGAIAAMRQVKEPDELKLMEKAIAVTLEAQRVAAQAIRAETEENWVAGLIDLEYRRGGCVRAAFPSIVGSGINSCVLHYPMHDRTIARGALVVVDIGAEYDHYAADVTRTYPADGKFTPEQRAIYELVLKVQNACIELVKPGAYYEDIHRHAEEMFREAGYRDDFIHGLGHWVGLDVHDAGDRGRVLEPGMVLTIEPGLYLLSKQLGVRIEDEVLVTKNGHRLLTAALPRDPDAIERMMHAE